MCRATCQGRGVGMGGVGGAVTRLAIGSVLLQRIHATTTDLSTLTYGRALGMVPMGHRRISRKGELRSEHQPIQWGARPTRGEGALSISAEVGESRGSRIAHLLDDTQHYIDRTRTPCRPAELAARMAEGNSELQLILRTCELLHLRRSDSHSCTNNNSEVSRFQDRNIFGQRPHSGATE